MATEDLTFDDFGDIDLPVSSLPAAVAAAADEDNLSFNDYGDFYGPPTDPPSDDDTPLFSHKRQRQSKNRYDDDAEEDGDDGEVEDELPSALGGGDANGDDDASSIDLLSDGDALRELSQRFPDTAREMDRRPELDTSDRLAVLKQLRHSQKHGALGALFDAIRNQQRDSANAASAASAAAGMLPPLSSPVEPPPIIPHPPPNRDRDIQARVLMQDPDVRHKFFYATGLDEKARQQQAEHEQQYEARAKRVFDEVDEQREGDTINDLTEDLASFAITEDGGMVLNSRAARDLQQLRAIDAGEAEQMLTRCWLCGTREIDAGMEQSSGAAGAMALHARIEDYKYANITNTITTFMARTNDHDTCVLAAIYYYNIIYLPSGGTLHLLKPTELWNHYFSGECIIEPRFTQVVMIRSLRKIHRKIEDGVMMKNALTMETQADVKQVKELCNVVKTLGGVYSWKTKDMAFYAPHMQIDTPQNNQLLGPRSVLKTSRKERH